MEEQERELSVKDLTYKPKKNNSYVIANAILESICYKNKMNEELYVSEFSDLDYYSWIDGSEDIYDAFNKSKNILKEATRVIRVLDLLKYKRPKYELSTDKWFEETNFSIQDNNVLKELCPLLLYYVGNCYEGSYTLFYKKLDLLIEYIIKPALNHNQSIEIERYIINSMNGSEEINILDDNGEVISVVAVKIKLKKVSENKVEKILIYECDEDSSLKEIPLNRVVKDELEIIDSSIDEYSKSLSFDIGLVHNEVKNESDVILECDTTVYEYFTIKPLKNMQLFDTEEKQEEFQQTYEIKPQDNKFYVVAQDDEEMILSTVLHTLPHAKILKPSSLNDKLISKFKIYANGIDYDMCDDETPPSEPETPSDEQGILENATNINSRKKGKRNKSMQKRIDDLNKGML